MFLSLFQYSGLAAKTAAMKQKHLSKEQYLELASKQSVAEICSYLKNNTVYGAVLSGLNERLLHRNELEELLSKYLQDEMAKIFHFVTGHTRKFLDYILVRYVIEQIKGVMRNIESGEFQARPAPEGFFAQKCGVDLAALYEAQTYRALLEVVKDTPYYAVLDSYVARKTGIFQMEMALDAYYFQYVWNNKNKQLAGQDNQIITDSLGREIDMLNLIWVYRCKHFYRLESELIYTHIIPIHYKLLKSELVALIETPNEEAFLNQMKDSLYAELFENLSVRSVEQNYAHMVLTILKKNRRKYPFSIAALLSYTHLIEIEIKNITSIIESIRYGQTPGEDVYTV